jgi:hypothetical protein
MGCVIPRWGLKPIRLSTLKETSIRNLKYLRESTTKRELLQKIEGGGVERN